MSKMYRCTAIRNLSIIVLMALFSAQLLTGCASIDPKTTSSGILIGSNRLFMNIAKGAGGQYSVADFNDKSGLVLVNDLSTTLDTHGYHCGFSMFWGGVTGNLKKTKECAENDFEFRKTGTDIGKTGLSYAVSAGVFAVFGVNYKYSYFDDHAYREAVAAALKHGNIDRGDLLRSYDQLVAERNKLDQLRRNYEAGYLEDLKKIGVVSTLIDKSGFYKKSANLASTELIKILPAQIKAFSELTGEYAPPPSLSDLRFANHEDLRKILTMQKEYSARYEEYLRKATATYEVDGAGPQYGVSYQIMVNAPKLIRRGDILKVPCEIVVETKDFQNIYPALSAVDENISLQFKDSALRLTNNTKKFLSIHSISVYYNDHVYTTQHSLELAPQTAMSSGLSIENIMSPKIKSESTYEKMTAERAKRSIINFGFAVKYRLVEQKVDKTLYQVKKYNLYDVLESRNTI